jgi:chromosome segregation ATPase
MLNESITDKETIKNLRWQINNLTSLKTASSDLQRRNKTLQRELADIHEQLSDVTHTRDKLRIELSDVRSQLNASQHDNRLIISQYDKLSEKYSAAVAEINNDRQLHEIKSLKQSNNDSVQHQRKQKKQQDDLWKKYLPDKDAKLVAEINEILNEEDPPQKPKNPWQL